MFNHGRMTSEVLTKLMEDVLELPRSINNFRAPNELGRLVLTRFEDILSAEQQEALDLSRYGDKHRNFQRRSRKLTSTIWRDDDRRRRERIVFDSYDALNRMAIYSIGDIDILDIEFLSFFVELADMLGLSDAEVCGIIRDCFKHSFDVEFGLV